MLQKFGKIYLILIFVLIILILAVRLLSNRQVAQPNPNVTPTSSQLYVTRAFTTPPPLIHPTSTGASEEIASATANLALQKQALRKLTPLSQAAFTLTFDYGSDNFIVTLNAPKDTNKTVFLNWLQQNYPLIPLSEFIFK